MQMLYHSDQYVVVEFDLPRHGGYEIVDRRAQREIYLDGLLAQSFKQGVQALADQNPSEDDYDEFISRYTQLAQQPLAVH
jgi:Protein of unknown function (DUF3567)